MPTRRELANAIRFLSMDAVQQANSGHPGMPMGMADIAEVLWNDFLRHNPSHPDWIDRDRFVLSNGHGSMLQYALLHLTGYELSIDDLRHFRQLHSKTPGHPEVGYTPGVETTTGPLGQGLANGVGMALAERTLAAEFNQVGHDIIDHYTYVFAGDGCLMEGVSHEACSLAGTQKLGKLIVFYDDNGISIDGCTEGWFTDDTPKRFAAYGWHVMPHIDGHDAAAIREAILAAQADKDRPSLLCFKTQIGYGAPTKAGSCDTHGAPLGDAEIQATRNALKWPYAPFEIPDDIYQAYNARNKGHQLQKEWEQRFSAYQKAYPELASELIRRMKGELPKKFENHIHAFISKLNTEKKNVATRKATLQCLQDCLVPELPELIGGSCDLGGSNGVLWKNATFISSQTPKGRYLHYGVREFGMLAINNGIALHGGFIPFGATFLTFIDYAKNALRLAAIMKVRQIGVFSHDSIGLGEDGPTHQPIEHACSLRITPNVHVWRPADSIETVFAWRAAIERKKGPTAILTTRQDVPFLVRDEKVIKNIEKGGYVLKDFSGEHQIVFIATGSEVELALKAAEKLAEENIATRVVSMPCCEVFDAQDNTYKNTVLPKGSPRIAIEAGSTAYWYKYVGLSGKVIGIDRYGESAPAKHVYEELGLTVDKIVAAARNAVKEHALLSA